VAEAQVQAEVAATGGEPGRRFASDEFFYLLQRVDRLDEKLTARIDMVDARIDVADQKLTARIDGVNARIDRLDEKLTSELREVQRGLNGTLRWTIGLAVACFGVMAGVLAVLIALMGKL